MNWTLQKLKELYETPLLKLIFKAMKIHQSFHQEAEIQVCHLISIKTGGCSEDCKYCAQSSRYKTSVSPEKMMDFSTVIMQAKKAAANGATRICLGAAWRGIRNGLQFDEILKMVKGITDLGLEVCCTLGMLDESQAMRLKDAGLYAYNHNLDSSESFYKTIITTRTYQDRLNTLEIAKKSGLSLCSGGILGMGESIEDRLNLLLTLSQKEYFPESFPINRLSPIPGTPLEDLPPLPFWEMLRFVAITRIVLPKTMVRLSAGRIELSLEQQALCFLAGANSIFSGEKLLTVANTSIDRDEEMFKLLGLTMKSAFNEK